MNALTNTDFHFDGQKNVYHGKVRDVYTVKNDLLVMIATDRISAFDVVLPKGIPYKGQMLNQIAAKFLDATADIVPNWKLATPDPMVTVGLRCEGYPVEMIVRGYLCGSAWRRLRARSAGAALDVERARKLGDHAVEPHGARESVQIFDQA
jgi:phosphoribosylaminoimidazole-succinocarboxamide synthase